MLERGLRPFDENSLRTALDRMKADGIDSDGDGVTDVEALRSGKDPNGEGGGEKIGDLTPRPEYGCFNSVAPTTPGAWAPVAAVVLARLMARRRRRARLPE
jgi:MYXO-CTERM domain-containing protein